MVSRSKAFPALLVVLNSLISAAALAQSPSIQPTPAIETPKENLAPERKPSFATMPRLAEAILLVLNAPTIPSPIKGSELSGFFPRAPFLVLKKVPRPAVYYDELTQHYFADLQHLKKALGASDRFSFLSFSPGFCKWKAVDSEYNHIAYWSCYGSLFKLKSDQPKARPLNLKVRTTINWGEDWYVTHLGRTAISPAHDSPQVRPKKSIE